ncbi:unnamed protein product [Calypogeia fissa]
MEAMVALSFISGPEYERVKPRVFELAPLTTETFNEEIPRLLDEFARMEVERRPRRTHIFQISHEELVAQRSRDETTFQAIMVGIVVWVVVFGFL